jgi:exonuclease SbcC
MKIVLKKLSLTNFKGIRSLSIDFNDVTNIYGDNATGKTTLMDGFLWLFFGKDSTDRKDFEIKTLDENNRPIHKLDHEVYAVVAVDGDEIAIRRCFNEKWETPRGSREQVFKGHTTSFYWNDVPMKESEYQAKVAGLINENLFKLITNTGYFNSLKWQERRAVLLQIAGTVSNEEVLGSLITVANKGDFDALISALNQKKTIEEFKKEISSKKKKIKDELENLPVRITEANRLLPAEKDYSAIEAEIVSLTTDLDKVEDLLQNKTKAQKEYQTGISGKIVEVGKLKSELQEIEFTAKNAVADKKRNREQTILDKKRTLRDKQDEKGRLLIDYNNDKKSLESQTALVDELRQKWNDINKEEIKFNENEFCCPTCKRQFSEDVIGTKKAELTNNFNADKAKRLEEVTRKGNMAKEAVQGLQTKIGNTKEKGELLKTEIEMLERSIGELEQEHLRLSRNEESEVKKAIVEDSRWTAVNDMIRLLEEEIKTPYLENNNSELLQRKSQLRLQLDDLKNQLAAKEQRDRILERINELSGQENTLANELSTLEGIEFSILQFEKAQMSELERRVNSMFQISQFKLFETQINGGEIPCCETLINGVPYSDANTASKIQSGLDIINSLSNHYDAFAPVWIDNRESVVRLPKTKSQLINLFVSSRYKKLTIGESREEFAEMA